MHKNISKIFLSILLTTTLSGCSVVKNNNQENPYNSAYNLSKEKNITLLYECEKQFSNSQALQGCKDFVLQDKDYIGNFYGHECSDTESCTAEEEGYGWAQENNISNSEDCLEYSLEFKFGCQAFTDDQTSTTDDEASLNETKAIDLVKNTSQVKTWLKQFSNTDGTSPVTGGRPVVALDSVNNNIYSIHVFESLTERNVTFNWYSVNLDKMTVINSLGEIVK
ncbi:MAG: hypothetical protein COU28_03505 [Candidatus Magasanikbacteria bacterium CG10_big_fil_rev_8_21_14_0_10_36_16]|uniref:Uncharacterized protein n=1 Tax=Candidatus Magasanikbacteria bacterium CG10_big_fil_rev_8_21_14_0_10_36_16 TaxID=1974645 RepID=A0A2H0TXZ5_9BACT|nr:MAG: hypothetical protein COU28_03505 [Candidatus Magasanikbacteria bacterium CG10_big_fil_rev_8_21_14_0_10_36_16]